MNLDSIEKVIDFTMFIKELISSYKQRDTFLQSINIFMDSITQSMRSFQNALSENKIKKEPSLPTAFDQLAKTLANFKNFLEKENKSNKFMKFLKGTSLRISSQQFMDEISKQLNILNLAVNVKYGNEQLSRFDDVVKYLESIDEKLNKVSIMKKFNNQLAADFWIQNFVEEQIVDSSYFMEKFKVMVYNQEKRTLTDKQIANILALLDEDQQKTVNFTQWDLFYSDIWSFFERKQELIQNQEFIIHSDNSIQLSDLVLIYEETNQSSPKEYDYPIKHRFHITDKDYEFVDISNNKVKNQKNLQMEGLVFGKKKPGWNPDIYFDSHLKTISGKQFQIIAKKYLNVQGYFISDLSTTNCTSFKVEKTPYALNNQMVLDLNGHLFEVLKVIPEPSDENNKGYYFVPTAGMQNLGDSLIEETIRKARKKRNSGLIKFEEDKNEEPIREVEETTLKRKPRAHSPTKTMQPTLILQCIEGVLKDKKFEMKINSNKESYVAGVGFAKDNTIVIDDEEGILDYNCQIVFVPEFNCWVIAEKWPKSKQTDYSAGTLVYLKTAQDYKNEQARSIACKLRNGMKIFFNCHVLSVNCKD